MKFVRKWLILTHRYVGIALSLLFVVWFASGIAMMYAREMPRLTPAVRLERLPAIDMTRVRITAAEAMELGEIGQQPDRVVLLTVMERPAYRFTFPEPVTVFADTGEVLTGVDEREAVAVGSAFMSVGESNIRHAGLLTQADQWTIGQRRQLPLHKLVVDDAARTELYVAEQLGEVVLMTTRGSRMLAWVAAIPHWLYFAPLRLNDQLWRNVVLWTSGVGALLALFGIVLGIVQLRPTRSLRPKDLWRAVPYAGWMRWHYITGMVFGVFTLTWVFSGMLSMDPWNWSAGGGGLNQPLRQAMSGGELDLAAFPRIDAAAWAALPSKTIKEIEFLRIHDQPYYSARTAPEQATGTSQPNESRLESRRGRLLISAADLAVNTRPFSEASLMARLRRAIPDVRIAEVAMLNEYDSYYYSRDVEAALPVLRVKLDDPDKTWLYVDPASSQIVRRVNWLGRIERWAYNGLHSLDFSFWYGKRPLWDIGVIVLSVGGLALSGIGLFVGVKRLYRGTRRVVRLALARRSASPSSADLIEQP